MIMENEVNRALGTASGMQHITRAGCLGTGHSAENEQWFPMVIGGANGTIPRIYYYYCCCWLCLLSQAFSSWHFSWTSGDPHHSGFKLHTAVLSVLCVMYQVQLSFVVNLSNVFLVQLPNFSLSFSSSSSSSSSPLCRVFALLFLRQTMPLENTVLQPFCCYYSCCLYCYFQCWIYCTLTLVLSEVCVQCPIWLFSVVPWLHGFLVCCSRIF